MSIPKRTLAAVAVALWIGSDIATALPQEADKRPVRPPYSEMPNAIIHHGGSGDANPDLENKEMVDGIDVGLCRDAPDGRAWREKTCEDPLVQEHTLVSVEEQWVGLDVQGAWSSAIDFVNCRTAEGVERNQWSNVISDFFHGPQGMFCQDFVGSGNGCIDLNLQCHDVVRPAGYYILNSMSRIYSVYWNIYESLGSVQVETETAGIASDFGIISPDKLKPQFNIILDLVVIGWGLVMGPTWNQLLVPRFGSGGSTVKDEINDMVKNSATISKDLHRNGQRHLAETEGDLQNLMKDLMLDLTNSWREATNGANARLFDGSDPSLRQLDTLMGEGNLIDFEVNEDSLDAIGLKDRYLQVMNAIMIQETWKASPEELYPVIIKEELGCDEFPDKDWTDPFIHYMTQGAFDKRICGEDAGSNSFWLVGPKKLRETCSRDDYDISCEAWDVLPGMQQLEDSKYGISLEDIILGSEMTRVNNGNGVVPTDLTTEMMENMDFWGIRGSGIFHIPVCGFSEAYSNWRRVYERKEDPSPNFPCN